MPTYTRSGHTSPAALATSIINDLRAAGLTPKYVNAGALTDAAGSMTATKATFEYTPDPLYATQPWRVQIDGTSGTYLHLGSAAELTDAGANSGQSIQYTPVNPGAGVPYDSILTVTPRGFALLAWNSKLASGGTGFVIAQRPVNPATGATLLTGSAPVLALANAALAQYVVRESDLTTASTQTGLFTPSTTATPGGGKAPDGSYWVLFPSNLSTGRAVYAEHLDLMAFVRASDFVRGDPVSLSLYGEGTARTYVVGSALGSSVNAGLRPLILTAGGGV